MKKNYSNGYELRRHSMQKTLALMFLSFIALGAKGYALPPDESSYVAIQEVSVDTYGKIYDLQVNNSLDPDWINKIKNGFVAENELPFGQAGQNMNMAYKYAPKLGYTFAFNFKTKGRKTTQVGIEVDKFYFVGKSDDGNPT